MSSVLNLNAIESVKPVTLKLVTAETVANFTNVPGYGRYGVTGSYLQTDRHAQVSEKFQVIQPAMIGAALAENGFDLVSVITGKSRHADKTDFQRTISRYRSNDTFEIEGLSLDLIYISKHMGRGCDEFRLGFYRGTCANQWAVGSLFEIVKFRHSGNPLVDLQDAIVRILNQRVKLIDSIKRMQNTMLDSNAIANLAKKYAEMRLEGKENILDIGYKSLARVHRADDAKLDLFTVANVLQENIVRGVLPYRLNTVDSNGNPSVRNMTTRRFKESSLELVDLNGRMFDAALSMAA